MARGSIRRLNITVDFENFSEWLDESRGISKFCEHFDKVVSDEDLISDITGEACESFQVLDSMQSATGEVLSRPACGDNGHCQVRVDAFCPWDCNIDSLCLYVCLSGYESV